MVLVSSDSADRDGGDSGAGQPDQDIVLRAALRSALQSVQSVCDQVFAQLAAARRESAAEAVAASERVAAIQAETESAVQRVRLEMGVEVLELGREVERLRNEMRRHEAVMFEGDASAEIEALRKALALSQSDCDEVNRRLLEEKQKHTRLIEAVRNIGTMNTVFRNFPAVSAEFDARPASPAPLV